MAENRAAGERHGGRDFTGLIIFVVALATYLLFPSRNYNYADDSLSWAYQLTRTEGLINSHHLYLNAMRGVYQAVRNAGINVTPQNLLAIYSSVWAALGLVFLYRLLKYANLKTYAIGGVLVCAFTAGYWAYAIIGDVYAPASALMIAGLDAFYRGMRSTESRSRMKYAALASFWFFLMLLHHQAHLAFLGALLPGALLFRSARVRIRWFFGLAVPAAATILTLGVYFAAYKGLAPAEQKGFPGFFKGYVENFDIRADQKKIGIGAIVNSAVGQQRALVSTNVIFRSEKLARMIQNRYPYRNVYPYPYLVRKMSAVTAAIVVGLAALATLLALILVVRGLAVGLRECDLVMVVFVAAVPQFLFFMWWEGISDEFALWTLPLVAIFAVRGAASFANGNRWLAALAASLGVSTFLGSVLPYSDSANDIDAVNDRYVSGLRSQDFLLGFEDIQSFDRISLAQERQGFEYFDIRNNALHWTADDTRRLLETLDAAVGKGQRILVAPYVSYPPNSQMVLIGQYNPNFESERAKIISKLRSMPNVNWVGPVATVPGFFRMPPNPWQL